jgi:hypothetical protein
VTAIGRYYLHELSRVGMAVFLVAHDVDGFDAANRCRASLPEPDRELCPDCVLIPQSALHSYAVAHAALWIPDLSNAGGRTVLDALVGAAKPETT